MVEGGAQVISSFMNAGHIDNLIVTIAPTFVGHEGVGYVMDATGQVGYPLQCSLEALIIVTSRSDFVDTTPQLHPIADIRQRHGDGVEDLAFRIRSLM